MIPLPDAIPVDEHPTADAARQALHTGQPYRGIWHTPAPDPTAVHLFASDDYPDQLLHDAGWTRADVAPHLEAVDADTTAAVLAIVDGPTRADGTTEMEGDA